jgi:NADH-quinone oxidoreductase subunit M
LRRRTFLCEALVITGMFQVSWIFATIALISLIVPVVYATRLIRGIVFGEAKTVAVTEDLTRKEWIPEVVPAFCALFFGQFSKILIEWIRPGLSRRSH